MRHKLLLADDSLTIQRVIELTFAEEDVEVVAVSDGRQAIERVQADRPDIVLADVGMPERNGYDVAAFIKGTPHLAHIHVLLLTGAFEPIDEARAREVGCDGVLVKPFEPQMVITRVRELLAGERRLHQPAASSGQVVEAGTPTPAEVDRFGPAADRPSPVAESLEDYFDRLDAALANVTAGAAAAASSLAASSNVASPGFDKPPGAQANADSRPPPADLASAPAVAPSEFRRSVPEPGSGITAAGTEASLSEAFAALLAAEQGQVASPVTLRLGAIPDEALDEIARRVIDRMSDDTMRRAVLDAAERLVREEIERIKASR